VTRNWRFSDSSSSSDSEAGVIIIERLHELIHQLLRGSISPYIPCTFRHCIAGILKIHTILTAKNSKFF
jgi:hypothetical protein